MKRIALLLTLAVSVHAAGPPAPYFPKPHVVYDEASGAMAVTMQPTSYGAMLVSPAGTGTDWTPMEGTAAVSVQPNNYVGLLVCTANCSSAYGQTWGPWNGSGGGGGATFPETPSVVCNTSTTASQNCTSPQLVTVLNNSPSSTLSPNLLPSATSTTPGAVKTGMSALGINYPVVGAFFNGNSYNQGTGALSAGGGQAQQFLSNVPVPAAATLNVSVSGTYAEQIAMADVANFNPTYAGLVSNFSPVDAGPIGIVINGVENNAANNTCTVGPTSNCITNFVQAQRASLAWDGIPKSYWMLASTATPSGPVSTDNTIPKSSNSGATGNFQSCTSTGCSWTFTVPATSNGHIFVGSTVTNSGTGTYSISIGGTLQTNPCTGTTTFSVGPCGGTAMLSATSPHVDHFYNSSWSATSTTVVITTTNAGKVGIMGVAYVPLTLPSNMNPIIVENGSSAFDPSPGYFSAASMNLVSEMRGAGLLVFPADVRTTEDNFPGGCYTGSTAGSHPNEGCYLAISNTVVRAITASGYVWASTNVAPRGAEATGKINAPLKVSLGFNNLWIAANHLNATNSLSNFAATCMYENSANSSALCDRVVNVTPLGGSGNVLVHEFTMPSASANCFSSLNYGTGAGTLGHCIYADGHVVQNGTLQAPQLIASGSAPTIAVGAAAGTGATASITGVNMAGRISITTGTSTTSSATLATITFSGTVSTAPQGCTLQPVGANANGQVAMVAPGGYPTTTGWTIAVAGAAIPASTTYTYSYSCM